MRPFPEGIVSALYLDDLNSDGKTDVINSFLHGNGIAGDNPRAGVIEGCDDNCSSSANGPDIGTCVKAVSDVAIGLETTCADDGDCVTGETCDMIQGDINTNGIGDA